MFLLGISLLAFATDALTAGPGDSLGLLQAEVTSIGELVHITASTAPTPRRAVQRLFTFASPPVTKGRPLRDGWGKKGAFEGYRIWSKSPWGYVDVVANAYLRFVHPLIGTIELHARRKMPTPSNRNLLPVYTGELQVDPPKVVMIKKPNSNWPCTRTKCHVDYYNFAYGNFGHELLATYWKFCQYTKRDMEEKVATPEEVNKLGYRVLAYATVSDNLGFWGSDDDTLILFQEKETGTCTLAFESTEGNTADWVRNAHIGTEDFCGFSYVHSGLAKELTNIVTSPEWASKIKVNMLKCSSVDVVGHSKGGGLATLLAACANRRTAPSDADGTEVYASLVW